METIVQLRKDAFSENVIRKSLYWLSEICKWELCETDNNWLVTLMPRSPDDRTCKAELDRLLNDFKLREELDKSTKGMRVKIVSAVLKKLGEHNE